ncbi:dUTP diphosphatase [Patescibacteria group bacterium]|nr:dUTP diphosphatase [Patescibacteria group bacterium]
MKIKIVLIEGAKPPRKALKGDAGYDIFSNEDITLWAGDKASIKTGFATKLEDGFVGLVWDKGGISNNYGVTVLGGVFDSNYIGEWVIGLVNLGRKAYRVEKGQKIAQVLFQKVEKPELEFVKKLPKTNRGNRKFNSTGDR